MGRLTDKIFDTISAGLVHINADLNIIEYNRLGLRAIGAEETSEIAGKPFFTILNDSDGLQSAFQKVLSEKIQHNFWGYPIIPPGKTEKTFWDYTISNLDEGLILSAVEVTNRVLTESGLQEAVEKTRQSAEKFEIVIEQMSDGVIVCDSSGDISKVNDAAEKMLGKASVNLIVESGTKESELIKNADGSNLPVKDYPWFIACSKGEKVLDAEILVQQSDDSNKIINVNATPLFDKNREKIGAVAVLRDVTENRHLISELRNANYKLEEYNRLKAEFVANMSHELRTPLTAIIGFVQLVQMRTRKGQNTEEITSDSLERILRNGRHLLTLIDEVLDLSKIEAGRLTLHFEPFDLSEMIEKTFGGLESLAIEKGLEYNLKIDSETPQIVFSDPGRIRQIVLNLLSNAIKFTHQGGIQVNLTTGDEKWQLSIKDSGLGIKEENLKSIFERFRQIDGSFTRSVGGFGLGLSISQQLAELLGGEIKVESKYGEGSTFTLILPNNAPMALAGIGTNENVQVEVSLLGNTLEDHKESEDDNRPTILVIDDLPDSTRLLSDILQNAGYRVIAAHSGNEGIKIARKIKPDAITLDVMMPEMDGWRVLQEMKADPQLAEIPIIVVSIVDNKTLGYRFGASDYLVKPIASDDLLQTLEKAIELPDETNSN